MGGTSLHRDEVSYTIIMLLKSVQTDVGLQNNILKKFGIGHLIDIYCIFFSCLI